MTDEILNNYGGQVKNVFAPHRCSTQYSIKYDMFEKIIDSLQQLGVTLKIQRSKYGALHALIAKNLTGSSSQLVLVH